MSSRLYNKLQKSKIKYDKKEVVRLIFYCKYCTNKEKVSREKEKLFFMLNKIVVKNVNNFYFLLRNSSKQVLHTQDDIVTECYFKLEQCINNFKIKNKSEFYLFYNTSLMRGIYRLVQKEYNKWDTVNFENFEAVDFLEFNHQHHAQSHDFSDIYIKKMGLTAIEKKILISKLKNENLEVLLKRIRISKNEYFKHLKTLKAKAKDLLYE